jgi:hypothetical protein
MRRALACVLLAGCGLGDGKGTLAGTLYVRECSVNTTFHNNDAGPFGAPGAERAYDMQPSYFVGYPVHDFDQPHPVNKLSLREQASGQRLDEADVMLVTIADVRVLAGSVGQPLDIGPVSNARASLLLNQTCPAHEVQMELDGTMTFTSFGSATAGTTPPDDFDINIDDRVAATFHFTLVDRRAITLGGVGGVPTDPSLTGHIDGDFDFIIRQGLSARPY